MALQTINVGAAVNDGTGDPNRTAWLKVNANFTELYLRAPGGLSGVLAADSVTGNYRAATIADFPMAGQANGLATLDINGKLSSGQIPTAIVGALDYQGTWNAATNTPTLASGTGSKGQFYKVSVAGTTTIDGINDWGVGDWIVFNGTTWDKVDNTDLVSSVAGKTGAVTLVVGDVSGAAPLASPALTGAPTAPTPTTGDSSTRVATTAFVAATITANFAGMSIVKGLAGTPNATTPNSKIDWTCNAAVLRDPASGLARIVTFPSTLTCDLGTNGVNGRDQAAAFSASTWVHFYYTWEGSALCTRASSNAPSAGGPTVTAGTQWAYLGAWFINASGNLVDGYQRGATFLYTAEQTAVGGGGAATATAINIAAFVPPNATGFQVLCEQLSVNANGSGVAAARLNVGSKSTAVAAVIARLSFQGLLASGGVVVGGGSTWLPNVSQQFFYFIDAVTGTSQAATIIVPAFRVPNGDVG